MHLRGVLRSEGEHHEPIVGRLRDTHPESLVPLLVDQHVAGRIGAHLVAPHLVGAPRIIGPRVEHVAIVPRPDDPVSDALHPVVDRLARGDVADREVEAFVALQVDRERNPVAGAAHRTRSEGEELAVARLHVAIYEHLLPRQRLVPDPGARRPHARYPYRDAVLQPLSGAREVPPALVEDGNRQIGLLGAPADLVDDRGSQRFEFGGHRLRVVVLGAQVGEHFVALGITDPGIRIGDRVAVERAHMVTDSGGGGSGWVRGAGRHGHHCRRGRGRGRNAYMRAARALSGAGLATGSRQSRRRTPFGPVSGP